MRFFGSKDIKFYVSTLLHEKRDLFRQSPKVLDIPSGNGVSLEILKSLGAHAVGADLFPELNRASGIEVHKADLSQKLPFDDHQFDMVLCQEGIEHIGGQDFVFLELSRILKKGGSLILTTPNYSSIKSRLSYLFTESEAFGRIMPPNEVDSIWLSSKGQSELYFGHAFLTGILRLRLFGRISGFSEPKIHASRVNYTSLLFFPLFYPFILFFSIKTYLRFVRKTGRKSLGKTLLKLMVLPKVLLQGHLILEFQKKENSSEARHNLNDKYDAGMVT